MNHAAKIYMQELMSERIAYLAKQMLNCPPDDTTGLLTLAIEAKEAANALNELAQPAEEQKPAAEIRKMDDVFKAVARNLPAMRQVRAAANGSLGSQILTDILTAFNPEKEAQYQERVAAASGDKIPMPMEREEYEAGPAPTPEMLAKTLEELGADLAKLPDAARPKANGKDARRH